MLGWWPRLLGNFYFPNIGSSEVPMREASAKHVDEYVASVQERSRTTLWEAQAQLMAEAQTKMVLQQKDRCIELETWQPGTSEGRCF